MMKGLVRGLIIGFGCGAVLGVLFLLGAFDSWQTKLSDMLYTPKKPRSDIVIIAIDDRSIQAIGRWPWDRTVHAELLRRLEQNKPKVIGLDVAFPEESNKTSDDQLAAAIKTAGNVVLPLESDKLHVVGNTIVLDAIQSPIPLFSKVASLGLVTLIPHTDGVTRQTPIRITDTSSNVIEPFSLAVLRLYLGGQKEAFSSFPTEGGQLRIAFVGKPGTFPIYSYMDVRNGRIPAKTFADKIVLIGATALDLHDTQVTPLAGGKPMSGVEFHANIIQTILDKTFLTSEKRWQTLFSLFALSIVIGVVSSLAGISWATVFLIVAGIGYIIFVIVSFDRGIIRNLVFPPLSLLVSYVVSLAIRYMTERKEKHFIKKALSYYLSDAVMKDVLSHPSKLRLGGQRKEITVLFSDIAGFTTISEKLKPEVLARLLNDYLSRMTKIVFLFNGVLDKYIGDAVMAFWGAPLNEKNHALLACKTALVMQEEVGNIKKEWEKIGVPDFTVRIGINTGDMVVGNMGSDLRFDYTLLGDNVNLGSRLEGINKEYGTKIIISEATYEKVKDAVVVRRLDTVAVKGKAHGVTIYELRGVGSAGKEQEFLNRFEEARKLYEQGKFKNARTAFLLLAKTYSFDVPIQVYLRRLEELIPHPPKNWDGIFHAKSK